ncbi:MAG: hypothetical protein ACOYM3_27850 [Terrimicrobiaceae bacterium]
MKRYLPYIIIAILFFVAGYLIGGISAASRAVIGSNSGSLVWLTGIHRQLADGKPDKASDILNTALDGHLSVIERCRAHPTESLVFVLPWTSGTMDAMTSGMLQKSKKYLISSKATLSPSSTTFLSTIPDETK